MDCVKFMNVICILAIPFFCSLYLIVEFQPQFYKYPKEDPKKLKLAIIVALIVFEQITQLHVVMSVILTLWHNRRIQAKRNLRIQQENGLLDKQKFGNIQESKDTYEGDTLN